MAKLALFGGDRTVTANRVSPPWPRFSRKVANTVAKMIEEGRVSSLGTGEIVAECEEAFAKYHGVKYTLAVSSGTASLHCAVAGCDIAPGDEVITSPYSWGATTGCILHQGAVPVFADVLEETGLLDPASVADRITRRTRAIVVVHIYGQPADMPALRRIARKHNLALIEDCSQAHGAKINGRLVGSFGDAAGFSCMYGKLLGTTEMGMMTTSLRDVRDRALILSQQPGRRTRSLVAKKYLKYVDSLIYTYRVTDINCALLLDQLPRLAGWNKNRAANRNLLAKLTDDIPFVRFPVYPRGVEPSYHMATLRYHEDLAQGVTRETFQRAMREEGVGLPTYVSTPIPLWERLQARRYQGPATSWMKTLAASGVKYSATDIPVCMGLSRKTSLQMPFNDYTEPEPRLMRQYANAFHKVAENLDALSKWQKKQGRNS